MLKNSVILVLLLLVEACGFRMATTRGEFSEQLSNIYVGAVSSSRELVRLIKKDLSASNINPVSQQEASALLHILDEKIEKKVLTLDSDGKAREYELLLQVTFEVQRRLDKSPLLKRQTIELSRNFVFDKSRLLGANKEEQTLLDEMRSDAAKLILYRLRAI